MLGPARHLSTKKDAPGSGARAQLVRRTGPPAVTGVHMAQAAAPALERRVLAAVRGDGLAQEQGVVPLKFVQMTHGGLLGGGAVSGEQLERAHKRLLAALKRVQGSNIPTPQGPRFLLQKRLEVPREALEALSEARVHAVCDIPAVPAGAAWPPLACCLSIWSQASRISVTWGRMVSMGSRVFSRLAFESCRNQKS